MDFKNQATFMFDKSDEVYGIGLTKILRHLSYLPLFNPLDNIGLNANRTGRHLVWHLNGHRIVEQHLFLPVDLIFTLTM